MLYIVNGEYNHFIIWCHTALLNTVYHTIDTIVKQWRIQDFRTGGGQGRGATGTSILAP